VWVFGLEHCLTMWLAAPQRIIRTTFITTEHMFQRPMLELVIHIVELVLLPLGHNSDISTFFSSLSAHLLL